MFSLTPFRNVFLDSNPQMFLLTRLWQMFLLNSVFSAPYYITVGSAVIQFSGGGGGGLYNLSCISVAFAPFNLLSSMYLLTWGLGFFLCLWTGVFSVPVHTFDWGFSPVCSLTGVSLYLLTLSCNVPFNSGTEVFFVPFDSVLQCTF
jgi:hypothetical protein